MKNFESRLFETLRAGAGSIWADYVGHSFVRGLATGALPAAAFRRYLVQDYLFLKQFVRAYALAGYKSTELDDIRSASVGMSALLSEMTLHVTYCREWGLDEAALSAEPEALETIAYTRFALERGVSGDLLDLLVALIPCVLGYAEIGLALAEHATPSNPYTPWITAYAGDDYQGAAREAGRMLDRVALLLGGQARLPDLQRTFNTATTLEVAFWQMGWCAGL